MAEVSANIV